MEEHRPEGLRERYRFSADRKAAHPKDHLEGFAGWMHSDGYAGFGALARAGPVREVACLAHVRRKFFDVHAAQGSAIAAEALERIAALYAIEKEARGQPPDQRAAIRRARAAPRLDELERWLQSQLPRISAKSPPAAAIRYARSIRNEMTLTDPPQAPAALYRARLPGDRQQPGRTRHEADCDRPEELPLHGLGQRRQGRRHRLYTDRDRQTQRCGPPSLARPGSRTHTALIGTWIVSVAMMGDLIRRLGVVQRIVLGIAGIVLLVPLGLTEHAGPANIAAASVIGLLVGREILIWRSSKPALALEAFTKREV